MSIVIALKYNGGTIVASDRQMTDGDIARPIDKVKSIDNFIAIAGVGKIEYMSYIYNYNIDTRYLKEVNVDECHVIRHFCAEILEALCSNKIINEDSTEFDNSEYIVATPNEIYSFFSPVGLYRANKYYCIGSGSEIAEGVINCYDLNDIDYKTACEIVNKALEVTCKLNVNCGLQFGINFVNLKEEG